MFWKFNISKFFAPTRSSISGTQTKVERVNVAVTHLSLILRVFGSVPGGTGYSGKWVLDLPPDRSSWLWLLPSIPLPSLPPPYSQSITMSTCISWCYTKSACEIQLQHSRMKKETGNCALTVTPNILATAPLRFLTLPDYRTCFFAFYFELWHPRCVLDHSI
jgi:hypothetical protein